MRKVFFEELMKSARNDKDLFFITADLGFGFVENYIKEFPNQFLNIGVSEQAMLGMANGLATGGKKVICYSIAAFSVVRPFEFFKNGAIANNNSVLIVGVGPGFDYSQDGLTHYCLEDLALLQSQPGLIIKTPFSKEDVEESVRDFLKLSKPMYLRLPRNFTNGESLNLIKSNPTQVDTLIVTTSMMVNRANEISSKLNLMQIKNTIGHIHEISKTSDVELIKHLKKTKNCLVVEDHYLFGGLGTRIATLILENNLNVPLVIDAVDSISTGAIGSFDFLSKKLMKSQDEIIHKIRISLK